MVPRVTVHVREDAARRLHRREHDAPEVQKIAEAVSDAGAELEPMHPGVEDAELVKQFTVDVSDDETARALIGRLRNNEAVEAAYVKPRPAVP